MKSLITIPIVILFFGVSTFGNFIVGYCPPPECTLPVEPDDCETVDCGIAEPEASPCGQIKYETACCGPAPKPIPLKKPRPPKPPQKTPVKARCVLPIILAFDPSTIPCCAKVCTTHGLSDFREGPKSDTQSLDLVAGGEQNMVAPCLEYDIPSHISRPVGVHPTISTTVLRL